MDGLLSQQEAIGRTPIFLRKTAPDKGLAFSQVSRLSGIFLMSHEKIVRIEKNDYYYLKMTLY